MEIGFNLDLDIAAGASKGGRIVTGIYKVEIIKNFLYKTEKGNNIIDLELRSENGEVGFINRLCIDKTWESGAENFDYPRWQELAGSVQMQSLTTYASKRKTADGEVDAVSIKELHEKKLNVAVYDEFDVYNNKEKVTLKLSNSFLADGRSITEAQAKKPAERIHKISSRLQPYETKEYKMWKMGNGDTSGAIDNVTTADVTAPNAPMAEEAQDDLFG
ncbi:MAG: hypothetical protein DRQ78_10600 [Epsilonproteobacteria bacterium]|nr:MAG: hypothetical protein DRQ78_10600 [Campylobacterota bacterium]